MKFSCNDVRTAIFYDEELVKRYLAGVGDLSFTMCELAATNYIDVTNSDTFACNGWNPAFNVIQYWDSDPVPNDVLDMINRNQEQYGTEVHLLFSDKSAREFINETYSDRLVSAYDGCFHPAMKSDYFRLAYLFAHGGLYIDADLVLGGQFISTDLLRDSIHLSSTIRHREPNPNGSWRWCPFADLVGRRIPLNAVCNLANDIILVSKMNDVIRVALVRATLMIERCKATGEKGSIHWLTGPSSITFSVWYHLIQSALGVVRRTRIAIFDKAACAVTGPLQYKNDERNWLRTNFR